MIKASVLNYTVFLKKGPHLSDELHKHIFVTSQNKKQCHPLLRIIATERTWTALSSISTHFASFLLMVNIFTEGTKLAWSVGY